MLAVISYRNAPKAHFPEEAKGGTDPTIGHPLQPLQSDVVHYNGQPIAVVVADTLERAMQAAALVRVSYREERSVNDFASAAAHGLIPGKPDSDDESRKKSADSSAAIQLRPGKMLP